MAKIPPIDIDSIGAFRNVPNFARQVKKAFQDLSQILLNISPLDNFHGFVWTGKVNATTEVKITNQLMKVPEGYLVLFSQGGQILAGDTAWSKDYVYLKNAGGTAVTAKVLFFV